MKGRRACIVLSAALALACVDDPTLEAETGESDSDDGEDQGAQLGDTPLPSCEAAMFIYEQIAAELLLPNPDPAYVAELYRGAPPDNTGESPVPGGSALQRWVREVDARLGRVEFGVLSDDLAIEVAIEQALAATEDEDDGAVRLSLVDVVQRLRQVASLDIRARLAAASEVVPDPARDPALLEAEWDQAWCTWNGVLRPLAVESDSLANEDWEAQIVAGFEEGHGGLEGPEQPWAPDEFATKPAKQIVEKSLFATIHRVFLARAGAAASGGDEALAREALGLFALLEDRVAERNTPALELISTMLVGDPGAIDIELLEQELGIAFVKRARKYCDEAVQAAVLGTPDGIKGAWEGIIYTRVVLPLMVARLGASGFDEAAYMSDWEAYLGAVMHDEAGVAVELSARLVAHNCALQAELGIADCTASDDEL